MFTGRFGVRTMCGRWRVRRSSRTRRQAFLEGEKIDIRKFRTSTGAEIRFIMPVLNVPFRLIYAFNPNRDHFQPKSAFKFAVGTTF